jgi:16S rRNA (cytosine1402-N4)-methyltransferase
MRQDYFHEPVLAETAVGFLISEPAGIYVDCTTGGGGHSKLILERLGGKGMLLCIDSDPDALRFAQQRLQVFENKICRQGYFDELDGLLLQEEMLPVNGFLFDLGISSFQIDMKEKGFSFQTDGPLDMRFNPENRLSAKMVINEYPREKLEEIFRKYGEERHWRIIARKIDEARQQKRIETTGELAAVIRSTIPPVYLNKTLARIFQAVRIEVNNELERLKIALEKAYQCLKQSGRMVIISYHSLEDRIVKEFFRFKQIDCICPPDFPRCICDKESEMHILTRRPVKPAAAEIKANPRSRSARLRVAEKIVPFRGIL